MLQRLADVCILATGWRRAALALIAGAVGGLAMPPLGLFPMLFVSFPLAVWLLDGAAGDHPQPWRATLQAGRQAAVAGWCFGFGYHLVGLWWLGAAFLVEPDKFAWALPLGVLGVPAGLAVFAAIGFALSRLFWSSGPGRVCVFAAANTLAEVLRANVLTGFPWNEYGMALGQYLPAAQVASAVGLHGLTLIVLLLGALPAASLDLAGVGRPVRLWPVATAVVLLVGTIGFGALRLQVPASPLIPGVKLRVMQPNIPQATRFDAETSAELVRSYLALSDRATSPTTGGLADTTHLVWPESPFPFVLSTEPRVLTAIAEALAGRTVLLTGGIRLDAARRNPSDAFNSLFVIGASGSILDSYDKVHLVPFGEYLPGGALLRAIGLRQFVELPGGFAAGTARRTVSVPNLPPVQPLICYEAIFPGAVTPTRADAPRPGVLLNITNDAWFGTTPGPYQHWAQARLRAVEEGIPLVRAANSGISGVTDGYGRILSSLPLGTTGVLDAALPRALPPTLFSRLPVVAPTLLWWLVAIPGLWSCLRDRRRPRRR